MKNDIENLPSTDIFMSGPTEFLEKVWKNGSFGCISNGSSTWVDIQSDDDLELPEQDVHFSPNTSYQIPPTNLAGESVTPEKVRTQNVYLEYANCIFVDDPPLEPPLPPSFLWTTSPGKYQAIWLLNESIDLRIDCERFKRIQAVFVGWIGGDNSAKSLNHTLRLPGSYSTKYGEPFLCEFIKFNPDLVYSLSDIEKQIGFSEPKMKTTNNHTDIPFDEFDKALQRIDPTVVNYEQWINIGMACWYYGQKGKSVWYQWSSQDSERYDKKVCDQKWESFSEGKITPKYVLALSVEINPKYKNLNWVVSPSDEVEPIVSQETRNSGDIPYNSGLYYWSYKDLMGTEFPEPNWIVPDLIPSGVVFLTGRPKVGKSLLALQIACLVGSGKSVLGRKVKKQSVLYIASEDSPRRVKERMQKQNIADAHTNIKWICTASQFPKLVDGEHTPGINAISKEITENGHTLIILDTLNRLIGNADQLSQEDMTFVMDKLQEIAIANNVCILIIDHQKKSQIGDPIDDLLGSTAKASVADHVLAIYRGQGKKDFSLIGRGRDTGDTELNIELSENLTWDLIGTSDGTSLSRIEQDTLDTLEDLGGCSDTANIAKEMGRDKDNTRKTLQAMIKKGVIEKIKPDKIDLKRGATDRTRYCIK